MAGGFFLLGNSLSAGLELLGKDHDIAEVEHIAESMLQDAKFNAPWEDRTGDARDGLEVDVAEEGGDIVVTLMHTMDYGEWLETIQSGRFAIIMPTLEKYAEEVLKAAAEGLSFGG